VNLGYDEGFGDDGEGGYRTEYFYRFWIAKALCGESFIDILYNSGKWGFVGGLRIGLSMRRMWKCMV